MKKNTVTTKKKLQKESWKWLVCWTLLYYVQTKQTHTQNHSTCDGIVIVTLLLSSREKRNRFYFYDFWYGNDNDNDDDDDDEYERFIYDANTSAQWLSFSYQTNRHG